MRLTELCQPWLRPFVSAPLWCCLSSALLVISLYSSFKDGWGLPVDIGGGKGNILPPFLPAVNRSTWGRMPGEPVGVTAFFFFFSLKEPTANASSHSTQRSQDSLLSYEILRNGHITSYLGQFSD